ncbi:RGD1306750 [Phodopus roborovskii]|uniref:RGD1306750 protein n=1 Tax=Phodopus roborovskii TaxID=109678 RepID=A0AAV0AAJ3_PHORO|nr:RGD1306750 [Phodopus roborovskii]
MLVVLLTVALLALSSAQRPSEEFVAFNHITRERQPSQGNFQGASGDSQTPDLQNTGEPQQKQSLQPPQQIQRPAQLPREYLRPAQQSQQSQLPVQQQGQLPVQQQGQLPVQQQGQLPVQQQGQLPVQQQQQQQQQLRENNRLPLGSQQVQRG